MSANPSRPSLLAKQLVVLRDRRADIEDLDVLGGPHDEVLLDIFANDLVGARLVIRAALATPTPHGISAAAREELERREREAMELLGVVLAALRGR